MTPTATSAVPRVAYTIDEAAQALGISRRTLERRIADGTIRVNRRFGPPLIPASELTAGTEEPPRRVARR